MIEKRNSQELKGDILSEKSKFLQVSVSLLDRLMNLAGELVLSRNQLIQGIGSSNMKTIELSGSRIDIITSEFQEAIMKTRMQPIANLFDTFKPAVKDLGEQHGKTIDLVILGKNVELDKTILEAITPPLNTLVTNSVKYGIEKTEERIKTRKKSAGTITLQAFHDAGQINITISDDGCGISPKAVPEIVTKTIEGLGGIIDLDSRPGQGSDVTIKLPLTLAIIPSQIISVGKEKYAIPQTNLSELIRISAVDLKEKIEKIGDAEVVRLRGEILPLFNLPVMLGVERSYLDTQTGLEQPDRREHLADRRSKQYSTDGNILCAKGSEPRQDWLKRETADRRTHNASAVNIAIVFAGNYKYGLVVDGLHDSEEIVVKPVGRHLKKYKSYAGATIMGDGKVALILDVLNLAQMAELSMITESNQLLNHPEKTLAETEGKHPLVIFKNQETEYFAAPFESVVRIERLISSTIEQVGDQKVVQYRGSALPLFELSQMIDVEPLAEREQQEVIVLKVKDREFGLMVTPPVDTIAVDLGIDDNTLKQSGIKGSMIINGHTTLLVDIFEMAEHFLTKEADI